jgi:methylase of polypeptide subunit release factors
MKSGEIDYLKNIGPQGSKDAFDKPFSDATRPKNLVDIGVVMALLPQPPARILDLGCGTGWTSWFLAKSGYDVVGQDIAQDMIDLAVRNGERYGTSSAKFVVSDYESAEYSEEFDAALFTVYDSH